MINLLLLNNFYPVMSYRRVQKESDELYTVWSLVMVRNQLSAQVVKNISNDENDGRISRYFVFNLQTHAVIQNSIAVTYIVTVSSFHSFVSFSIEMVIYPRAKLCRAWKQKSLVKYAKIPSTPTIYNGNRPARTGAMHHRMFETKRKNLFERSLGSPNRIIRNIRQSRRFHW